MSGYVELQTITNYSFLRGASHPEELFGSAQLAGFDALGVADHNTLAGIVQAHQQATTHRVRLIVGCRLDLTDSDPVLVFPKDRAAYVRLCHLLTLGKSRGETHDCLLGWDDLAAASEGQMAILLPTQADDDTTRQLRRMADVFGKDGSVALTRRFRPGDDVRLYRLAEMGRSTGVAPVVTGDVLYHHPHRRILQDVLTCIRHGCTIENLGFRREMFAERQLKAPELMQRRFDQFPEALARSVEIADACRFSLDELQYQYPDEAEETGEQPHETLRRLVREMIPFRYPAGLPDNVGAQLRHELKLIREMEYEPYFLTVHSIVRYARSQGILCQGRGSAANSAVCYVLGVTSIDPIKSGLLFERFISAERREPPDIDVDFESDRREEVIQWIYQRYGRDRAALVATVQRYRAKGALRDVGKVLGLTEDMTGALAGQVWGGSDSAVTEEQAQAVGMSLDNDRLRMTLELARELIHFPRQFGTHPGGFVLTRDKLSDLVPIKPAATQDRQVIEWDKNDIETLKFMKVDVLGLGMLGCLRRCFDLLEERTGQSLDIATIPAEDPETYKMIQRADTIGTFQIESRAQMSMLPRMKPKTFYDLVIEVAIVRPGPIQGDMVHPYLRRREGKEKPDYPTPELRGVLEKTLGVPLFQEQAMQLAIVCAGFTPGEADQLRRSMATFKFTGGVSHFKTKLVAGMVGKGYSAEFAEKMFSQLEGFGSYGFPESHAASFALIAYASCWVKRHHPAIFTCSLINSQPMGFYAEAQLVRDAREHGVEVRSICINRSRWDCTIEEDRLGRPALRLGLRMVKGLSDADGIKLVTWRGDRLYQSVDDLWRRAEITRKGLEVLAEADAYQSLEVDRRRALWIIKGLAETELPLFAAMRGHNQQEPEIIEPTVLLPAMAAGRHVVEDYRSTGLTLRQHPLTFLREELASQKAVTCADLANIRDGKKISVAGLMLVRQKPGSAKGVMFITIEDETGVANLIVWPSVFERQRALILSAGMLMCHGKLQKEAGIIHVIVDWLEDRTSMLRSVGQMEDDFDVPIANADEAKSGGPSGSRARPSSGIESPDAIRIKARNFR